jgi:hypothetical protein
VELFFVAPPMWGTDIQICARLKIDESDLRGHRKGERRGRRGSVSFATLLEGLRSTPVQKIGHFELKVIFHLHWLKIDESDLRGPRKGVRRGRRGSVSFATLLGGLRSMPVQKIGHFELKVIFQLHWLKIDELDLRGHRKEYNIYRVMVFVMFL